LADQRITQLVELSEAGVAASDVLAIVDISGSETKKVTAKNLVSAGVDLIDAGAIDLNKLDQSSTTKLGTASIADDAITYAKIQNVTATDRLLGRSTIGSGVIEEITCTAAGRALLDDADATAQRTTLGLGTIATQNSTSPTLSGVTITSGTITGITDLAITDGGTGASTALNARTNLGLEIGTDVQAYDAGLNSIAGLTTAADQSIYLTGADTYAAYNLTAFGRSLLDDADAAAGRTTLGLGSLATLNTITSSEISDLTIVTADLGESSVTVGKLNLNAGELAGNLIANNGIATAQLDNSAVTTAKIADNAVTYAKIQNTSTQDIIIGRVTPGAGDLEEITCTAAGRALIDDVTVADQRTTLGLGTLATQSGTFSGTHSGTTSGTNTGDQTITLTGDVTGSGTGSFATTISAGVVGTTELASDAVTYEILQDTSITDVVLGRSSAGGGTVEEIACTAAGRTLIAGADAAAQRSSLGLGNIALSTGTWTNGSSFSGTSSGTNTGDQTITLTGAVTGSGSGSFATTLANDIVLQANIASSAVTTAKINDSAVTEAKLADQSTSVVSTNTPSGTGNFTGQGWYDTSTGLAYVWDGTAWSQEAGIQDITVTESTPLSIVVTKPDNFSADLTITLDTQVANSVFAGPTTGADATPTFRSLVPADLPDATASTKGAVIPGTGLSVTTGTLNHTNNVTGATVSGITFDAQGHISAAVDLVEADIPDLSTSKITSGTFATALIADDAITAAKLANKSTAQIGETLPVADFIGQMFFNPLDNVWQSIGISAGAIVLAGTYDASTNQVASVTGEGTAIGLSVGSALPSASNTNSNYYLVVSEPGTGTSPAPTVALAPPDLILSTGSAWLEIDVSSTYTAQTASNVAFTPAANLGSTNVQSALEEVSNECRDVDNMTGGVLDVNRGGTNIASYTKGDLLAASASTTLNKLAVGTNGYILSANSSTTTGLEWIANQAGTVTSVSGTSPVQVATGTTTPVISVDAGTTSAAGILQLTDGVASSSTTTAATPNGVKTAYDLAALAMPKAGGTFSGQVLFNENASLVFEGASPDNFETTLAVADPTADHTVTLPNLTGTVALTSQLNDGTFD
jgi:hypothetical protein